MDKTPKAILFDLGGTLLRETRLEHESAIDWLLHRAGIVRPETLQAQFLDLYSEIRRSLRAGPTEFPIRGFITLALDWTGVPTPEETEELELEFWKRLCSMQPLPGVANLLRELQHRGIKTGVVSNSVVSSSVLCYELQRNKLLNVFEFVMSSANYGIQKPHPMIFHAALARLDCEPGEVWFAGDSFEKDVVGASNVGMRAVWLTQENVSRELPPGSVRIAGWQQFLPLLDAPGVQELT